MKRNQCAILSVLLACLWIFPSCKKDFPRQSAVITVGFDKQTATVTGRIIDLGQYPVSDHGFCWDSAGFPSISGLSLKLGKVTQTGDYTGLINGLSPNRVYYIKAFVVSEEGTDYGNLVSFTTPDLPSVTTDSVRDITETTANIGGAVSTDGGSPVTGRGICWNDASLPDTSYSSFKDTIQATGSYSYALTGLTGGKTYYVRAYAMNLYGIRYANEVTFTTNQPITLPIVTTVDITDISINTASAGGNVVSDGGGAVSVRGVCWSSNPYPTTDNNKTTDGSGTGTFTSSLSGLTANTTYYLRAYATNIKGTAYGDEKSFATSPNPGVPSVITSSVTDITTTTASSGGTVLEDGGAAVTARGVCWSSNPSPSIEDYKTSDGSGVGSFTSSISGLNPSTKYYIRAYATNKVGTSYGNEVSFTAGQNITAPTVTTTEVVNVTQTTATCGGNVTADGGAAVTARGVCWGIFNNPTISNSHTTDGSGTGGYLSSITGLFSSTTYFVRAYASNSAGTSYGNERQFTTLAEATLASVTTAPITNITNNSATSGGTVTNDGGASVTARGVCWTTGSNPTIADPHTSDGTGTGSFVSQLTGLQANTFYRVRAYVTNSVGTAYGSQQTFSTLQNPVLPTVSTTQAFNITSTTATTGGTVNSDGGAAVTARGVCYSTSSNPTLADSHTSNGTGTGTFLSTLTGLTPSTVYYVRAYATNSVGTSYGNEISFTTLTPATLATVTTADATNITETTATSGGNVTSDGGATVTTRGVCWSTTTTPTIAGNHTTDGSGTGAFVSSLTGLTENTLYYVRAYSTNSVGTAYGNEITFTTASSTGNPCPGIPTVTYEGKTYNTVQIGTQCWFKENLNVGTKINGTLSQTNNGIKEKYCYNDLESNCDVYGGLYQWNEAMQYLTNEGAQGLCPSGWHLPTDAEWTILTVSLGGENEAGGKLKETGTTHWAPPNTGATNSSGFTGLPGGFRDVDGYFAQLSGSANFYSSTEYGTNGTWYRALAFDGEYMYRSDSPKTNGYNIRCLQGNQNPALPTVTTTNISDITQTTATGGGNVISDGGAIVTVRGVCWSTSTNPTTANSHTTDGSGTGIFVSNLTGLTAGTLYYVRAYAINTAGTAYGNEISFTTIAPFQCGTTVSYSGITYNTVQIGTQCWFKENLNVGTLINGSSSQTNNAIIEKYCYNNLETNCDVYGGLYQWDEAMQYVTTESSQGICPSGWHVPSDTEWTLLTNNLGGESVAGGKMKEAGTIHWQSPNTGATNSSGFTALPGGIRGSGSGAFTSITSSGYFWSSTETATNAWHIYLTYSQAFVSRVWDPKPYGFSIRCLQN